MWLIIQVFAEDDCIFSLRTANNVRIMVWIPLGHSFAWPFLMRVAKVEEKTDLHKCIQKKFVFAEDFY